MKVKQIRRLFIALASLLTSQFMAVAQEVNFEISKTEGCTPMHVVPNQLFSYSTFARY